jgi:hypothetical protein
MLRNVSMRLILELNLVPVIVERDDRVDRVAELRHKQQGVDGVDDVFGRHVYDPIAIQN